MSPSAPLRNLTTHQLQYLSTVSRTETMADAAEILQISPSALSQGLSELERRLGLDLFVRQGRHRVLTVQGREAAAHADRILASVRDLTLWADAAVKGDTGLIRLGLIDIAAVNYFPETLIAFRAERPSIELRLSVGPSASLVSQLMSGQLDAAVIVEAPDPPGRSGAGSRSGALSGSVSGSATELPDDDSPLTTIELFTEDLAIYAPNAPGDDPTKRRRVGKPSTWGPWVTFPPESHTRRHVAAALRELGAEFLVEAESHQPEVLRQMVNLGMGWTVLPVLQAETEPNPLVRARKQPLLTRRLVIARRRGTPIEPATSQLIERLRERASQLSGQSTQASP